MSLLLLGGATSVGQNVAGVGIATAEALGATAFAADAPITLTGIATGEALGATLLYSNAGTLSFQVCGSGSLLLLGGSTNVGQNVACVGITTAEAFGLTAITGLATTLPTLTGIATAEALGATVISNLAVLFPVGIDRKSTRLNSSH